MDISQLSNDPGNLSGEDKNRKRNDIQREVIMQESELHKKIAEKTQLEAEIRKLKKDIERTRVELQERQERFSKMDYEILQMEESVKHLKKDLYLIR